MIFSIRSGSGCETFHPAAFEHVQNKHEIQRKTVTFMLYCSSRLMSRYGSQVEAPARSFHFPGNRWAGYVRQRAKQSHVISVPSETCCLKILVGAQRQKGMSSKLGRWACTFTRKKKEKKKSIRERNPGKRARPQKVQQSSPILVTAWNRLSVLNLAIFELILCKGLK